MVYDGVICYMPHHAANSCLALPVSVSQRHEREQRVRGSTAR